MQSKFSKNVKTMQRMQPKTNESGKLLAPWLRQLRIFYENQKVSASGRVKDKSNDFGFAS